MKYIPILGILCLVYYSIIIYVSGIKTAFSLIWVLLGGLFIFLPKLNRLRVHWFGTTAVSTTIKWGFISCTVIAVCIVIIAGALIISGMMQKGRPGYSYIIILGAQVKGEQPGLSLEMRLEEAYLYMKENLKTRAVLSGGQGPGEDITEAECMRRYLTEKGIDPGRLILEEESTSTYENIKLSAEKINDFDAEIGIISNDFHIYRAVQIARKQGFVNVSGIAAATEPIIEIHFFVREIAAIAKDKLVGNI
ncbi:MAG: ElyC/SanA/YdcF family protein [Lachnospiraceae bacterium]